MKGEIWPTPATQEVVVNIPVEDHSALDMLGRSYELRPLGARSYDVSHLASGIYFIRTQDGQSLKLIKQ